MYLRHFVFILFFFCTDIQAQEAIKLRPSPLAVVTMQYEDTYIKVTYSQPHKRGRKIFGGLVPFGQIWRTGANEATQLTTTTDIKVGNEILPGGTYSIFTIPGEEEWTVVFNSKVGLWGAYNYNEEFDVLRITVPSQMTKDGLTWEPFTMEFEAKNEKADLVMKWEQTRVKVPIEIPE